MDFSDLNIKNVDENLRNEFKELIKKEFPNVDDIEKRANIVLQRDFEIFLQEFYGVNKLAKLLFKEFIEYEKEYEQFGDFDLYGD